jgi:hypothetical protein
MLTPRAAFRLQQETKSGDNNDGRGSNEGTSLCSFVVVHDRG